MSTFPYTGSITVSASQTIKAVALAPGKTVSNELVAAYVINTSWVPTVSLPLNLFLDGDDAGTLSSAVSAWPAGTGSSLSGSQSSAPAQPTVVAGLNGHRAARFSGSQSIIIPSFSLVAMTIVFVLKCNSAGYNAVFTKTTGGSAAPEDQYDGQFFSASSPTTNWANDTTTPHVIVMQGNFATGADVNYWLDGANNYPSGDPISAINADTGTILVGNRGDGVTGLNGDLSAILEYQGILNSTDIAALTAACNSRFGL